MAVHPPDLAAARVAASAWDLPGPVRPVGDPGLINGTWLVGGNGDPAGVLQWVNPIFAPEVNRDIHQLTQRLAGCGMPTPRVLPTRDNQLWQPHPTGCWRMLSFVPGRTLHSLPGTAEALEGGRLVGRFHAALDGWTAPRHAPVRRIHDTPARMTDLRAALEATGDHPLHGDVSRLAEAILEDWERWSGTVGHPERTCHGDLKISNLRFEQCSPRAVCLIDLDTVGPMELACELGDMWRSWCNTAGEDDPEAVCFDLDIFEASATGFLEQAPELTSEERRSLVSATTRICLELAARFAADAVLNNYFREDRVRFPEVGTHNLRRARAQHNLSRRATQSHRDCARILGTSL